MARPCTRCGSAWHTGFTCPRRQRKPIQTRKPLQAGRRMKRVGRIGKALLDQRAQYFHDNPPPYYCIYCLVVGIDTPIMQEDAQVEHGKSKTRHPALRFVKDNLYVSCAFHNEDKRSRDIDEYIEMLLKRTNEEYPWQTKQP